MNRQLLKEKAKKILFNREFYLKLALFVFVILVMGLYAPLNKPRFPLHFFQTPIDDYIPLLPFFIVFYLFIHNILLYGTMAFSFAKENKRFYTLFYSLILANLIAYVVYYFFQSTVIRPPVTGQTIFSLGVAKIYASNFLYNAFPSGHAYHSTIILTHWLKSNAKKSWKIIVSVLIAAVLLSTLFLKQHYVLDVIAGITLGSISYILVFSLLSKKKKKK